MNNQTMRLAVEAGFLDGDLELFPETIERFAKLVRLDEREACAKLCEDLQLTDLGIRDWVDGTYDCAKAIKARGEK